MQEKITILVSERPRQAPADTSLFQLRDQIKPDADIVIYNGAPAMDDRPLHDGDAVVFIRRGEMPDAEELEALMAARHTPGVHRIVRAASVGIAGLGGLGSAVAIALARIGVGRLVLADFDVVEPSNLNRQQYFVDQIGMQKTDALAGTLERINPTVQVQTHPVRLTPDNVSNLFGEVDVLTEAFDRAEEKAMLMETTLRTLPNTPLVMASGLAGYETANRVITRKMRRNLYCCGDGASAARPGHGLMAPRVGVAAHHQANAVMRLLLGEAPEA